LVDWLERTPGDEARKVNLTLREDENYRLEQKKNREEIRQQRKIPEKAERKMRRLSPGVLKKRKSNIKNGPPIPLKSKALGNKLS